MFTADEPCVCVGGGLRVKCLHFMQFVQITHDNSKSPIADSSATPVVSLSMNTFLACVSMNVWTYLVLM